MNKLRLTLNMLAVLVVCLVCSTLAQAQATRTWVSGVGDDANPCSRTAPCKTFAGAISKTAPKGEINVLDPGGFGAVTITKAMTIRSECVEAGVLVSGTNAIIISAGTADVVTLSGLDINGVGTGLIGIKILSAKTVNVDKCTIYEFRGNATSRGISDERSNAAVNNQLFVTDCIIRDNSQTGLVVQASGGAIIKASVRNTQFQDNGVTGIVSSNGGRVTVSDSVASGNGTLGFAVEGPAAGGELNLENCVASGNGTGISAGTGGSVRISNMFVVGNGTGLSSTGGTFVTFGNNKVNGNGGGNTVPGAPAPIGPQ